jgi:hypothetical protein
MATLYVYEAIIVFASPILAACRTGRHEGASLYLADRVSE